MGHDLSPAIKAISAQFLPEQGWIRMILTSDSPLITEVLFPLINGTDDYCNFIYKLPSGHTVSGKACIESSGFGSYGNFHLSLIISGDVLRS